jgi:hypothetical protein
VLWIRISFNAAPDPEAKPMLIPADPDPEQTFETQKVKIFS